MPSGLDARHLRYMSRNDFRVLVGVEMGMRNHEFVPVPLVEHIAALKRGGAFRVLRSLLQKKLVAHESIPCDSYRLTSMGYDYLALHALTSRGSVSAVGHRMGVGKESDVHVAVDDEGRSLVVKMHRLGRTCFRAVRNKRDYLRPGQHATWLYLSRLSALKEFAFMKALHMHGFPVPEPVDVNRHVIVMGLCKGFPLNQVQKMPNPGKVYEKLIELYLGLANYGVIHCDFNEFNLLVDDDENVTLIDFPQMVSTEHPRAKEYFDRDVECLRNFFSRRFGFLPKHIPSLDIDAQRMHSLDTELAASGWSAQQEAELRRVDTVIDRDEEEAFVPACPELMTTVDGENGLCGDVHECLPIGALADDAAAHIDDDRGQVARCPSRYAIVSVAVVVVPRTEGALGTGTACVEVTCKANHGVPLPSVRREPESLLAALMMQHVAAQDSDGSDWEEVHNRGEEDEEGEDVRQDANTVMSAATLHRQHSIARRVRQEHGQRAAREALRSAKHGNRSRKTSKRKADGNNQAKAAHAARAAMW